MTGTAVSSTPRDKIMAVVTQYSEQMAKLAPRGSNVEEYIAGLRLYMASHPKLLDCTPASIAVGMLRVAQTGLTLGVTCDLLPFGQTVQYSPRYAGIIQLAVGSGVRSINADVVREGDFFEWQKGTEFYLRHRAALTPQENARITHAYAVAELRVGAFVFDVWDAARMERHRQKYSKGLGNAKGSKLEDVPWFAKKTMVRQLAQYLPQNARLAATLQFAEEDERVDETTGEIREAVIDAEQFMPKKMERLKSPTAVDTQAEQEAFEREIFERDSQ